MNVTTASRIRPLAFEPAPTTPPAARPVTSQPSGRGATNDGYFLGADGKAYPPGTSLESIPAAQPKNKRSDETIVFVNGIWSDQANAQRLMQQVADGTGQPTVALFNATEGKVQDFGQVFSDKLGLGTNPAVDSLSQLVYDKVKKGESVHIIGFSQGALITSRALRDVVSRLQLEDGLTPAQAEARMNGVKVETMGGAAATFPDGPQYVHYANVWDPAVNFLGLLSTKLANPGKGAKVRWLNELRWNPLDAHDLSVYLSKYVPFDQARR